jgi:hypothetical protein
MTLRIGELVTQVAVQGQSQGQDSGTAGVQADAEPGWAERERYRRLRLDERRDAARTAGEGFDG